MSTLVQTYGDRLILGSTQDYYGRADAHTLGVASPDGRRYRVRIRLAGWTGAADAFEAMYGGVVLRWGGPVVPSDPGEVLDPLLESTLTVYVRDRGGRLGWVLGRPDGAVQAVLEESDDDGATWSCVWGPGYMAQDGHRDTPYVPGFVPLVFHDGIPYLADRPAFGDASTYTVSLDEDVAKTLRRCLGPLGSKPHASNVGEGWEGVVTAADWHPYLPAPIGATEDPLDALETDPEAWLDEDGGSDSMLAAVRGLAARFGLRVFQSLGRWWLLQRDAVAEAPDGIRTWLYPRSTSHSTGTSPAATYDGAVDLTVDTAGWAERADASREMMNPARSVESAYDFEGVLDNLVLNGSFEDEGPGGATEAAYWTTDGSQVIRVDLTDGDYSDVIPAEWDNVWGLGLSAVPASGDANESVQEGGVFLPSARGWAVTLTYSSFHFDGASTVVSRGGVVVAIGNGADVSYLTYAGGTVASDRLEGSGARVLIEPLSTGAAEVAGTPVIPEGTALPFFSGTDHVATLTLTRPGRVGDLVLVGDLDGDLDDGDTFPFYYWGTAPAVVVGVGVGTSTEVFEYRTFRTYATGVRPNGDPVYGDVVVRLKGMTVSSGAGAYTVYDDVRLGVTFEGDVPDLLATLVHRGTDAAGVPVKIPVGTEAHPVGDGPLPDSETGLEVGAEETYQGADTGWKFGPYEAEEESSGVGLEAFHATRALQQLGTGRQRIHTTFDLASEGGTPQRVLPESVLVYWQGATTVDYYVPGTTEVEVRAPVRAGASLVLGLGTAREETVTVSAVADGAHGTVCTVSATTHEHYLDERCAYSGHYLPDEIEWVVDAGEVRVSATELHMDAADYITELRLGRAND